MRGITLLTSLLAIIASTAAAWRADSVQQAIQNHEVVPPRNPNHLFNAVHSSMRQWGSSWFHNGMSFFLAHVPADTQFYHGTHTADVVKGMEWLAFEPEHANFFAHAFIFRNDNRTAPQMPPGPQKPGNLTQVSNSSLERKWEVQKLLFEQNNLGDDLIILPGWLHTYRTKHDLHLVYIDGMSAGKTTRGTLDSQDFILANGTSRDQLNDISLATEFCAMAKTKWHDRIDGFIRMEGGFEIILCEFHKHLDLVDVHNPEEISTTHPSLFGLVQFQFFRAIASRYHGIGGHRVTLDYDNFVSVYTHNIDLFHGDLMPRLSYSTPAQRQAVKKEINEMVLRDDDSARDNSHPSHRTGFSTRKVDWQAVADLIVARYAEPLQYLTWPKYASNATIFHAEVRQLMAIFIIDDSEADDLHKAEQRAERQISLCTAQFIPPSHIWAGSLGGNAVYHVLRDICSTLLHAVDLSRSPHTLADAVFNIQSLVRWLDWSVWRECGSCAADSVCVIPIWPLTGLSSDREQPKCKNETQYMEGLRGGWPENYWVNIDEYLGPGIPLDPAPESPAD